MAGHIYGIAPIQKEHFCLIDGMEAIPALQISKYFEVSLIEDFIDFK
jgi:hypothetical protein